MNSKQIECALELSRTLNFSRASENLYISQPALTYQIQSLENEIGFKLFERSGKGAMLTPAGKQFCQDMFQIYNEVNDIIQRGQNMSSTYKDSLNVCLPMRSSLYYLPQIIKDFNKAMPTTALNITFMYGPNRIDAFLKKECDIIFSRDSALTQYSHITLEKIYESRFYIIAGKDDSLSQLSLITEQDLVGRTLMIGGGSPPEMVTVQNRIIKNTHIKTMNSLNHETSLTNVAANIAIVLAPGFTNDHNGEFAWIPFDCQEHINCVLAYHKDNHSQAISKFIEITKRYYQKATIPL